MGLRGNISRTIMALASSETGLNEDEKYVGGGEVLKYIGNGEYKEKMPKMDTGLIGQYALSPVLKLVIILLMLAIAVILISKLLKVQVTVRGRGVAKELKNIEKIRRDEDKLIKTNNLLNTITRIVEKSPFKLTTYQKKELQYRLRRADIKSPDGRSIMKAETYNAILVCIKGIGIITGVFMILFINVTFGAMLIVVAIALVSAVSDVYIKSRVDQRDTELRINFTSLYLMIHYPLMRNTSKALVRTIEQYDKTTESDEMHKFVDVCVHNFSTYGELNGTTYIEEEYKQIREVVKLMRLIRQARSGGDIRAELNGFKQELLNEEAYRANIKKRKAMRLASRAEMIEMLILVQAVISAMAIYLADLGVAASSF